MTTIGIINGMAGLADEQKKRMREQNVSHQAAVQTLERALKLKQTQQYLQIFLDLRAQEIQAKADIRLRRSRWT